MDRVSSSATDCGDNSRACWIAPSRAHTATANTVGDSHANTLAMVGDAKWSFKSFSIRKP